MNTPYEQVYESFLSKIVDFDLPKMTDDEFSDYCHGLMESALVKIRPLEHDLLNKDDDLGEFRNELLDAEIETIACHMVAEWITPKIYTTQLTTMFLGTKDEKFNSQANLIAALRTLKEDMLSQAHMLRRDYQYQHSDYMDYE